MTLVDWAGKVPPGEKPNPFHIFLSPLAAAQLAMLLEHPVVAEQIACFPKAYAELTAVHDQIAQKLDAVRRDEIKSTREASEIFTGDRLPAPMPPRPGDPHLDYDEVRHGLQMRQTGPRPFARGSARVPSYGTGIHLRGGGAAND